MAKWRNMLAVSAPSVWLGDCGSVLVLASLLLKVKVPGDSASEM